MNSNVKFLPLLITGTLAALFVSACSGDDDTTDLGPNPTADGGTTTNPDALPTESDSGMMMTPDSGRPDAGRRDAQPMDALPNYNYGTKIADLPASTGGISADETTVFYVERTGRIMQAPAAGGQATFTGIQLTQNDVYGAFLTPNMWFFSGTTPISPGPPTATLQVRPAGTSSIATVAMRVVPPYTYVGEGGNYVITAENLQARNATTTADFAIVQPNGNRRVIIHNANLGAWSPQDEAFAGNCFVEGAFTSTTTALLTLCPNANGPDVRELVSVDLVTGSTRTIARDILFPFVSPDGDYILMVDVDINIIGARSDGSNQVPLVETEDLSAIRFLDGRRFAYSTSNGALKVASYPRMTSTVLTAFGATRLGEVSPDGQQLMFSEAPATGSRRNLFVIGTSTASMMMPLILWADQDGFPGDDGFSKDSQYVYFYGDVDESLIGAAKSWRIGGPTNGNDVTENELSGGCYYLLNYGDPNGVFLMVNTRIVQMAALADIAVAKRDGTGTPNVLAGGADTGDFRIFPSGNKVFYSVPSGMNAGLWVRDLPAAN